MELAGKTATVTGSSSGIGRSIALALAREGAAVAVNYARDAEGAQSTTLPDPQLFLNRREPYHPARKSEAVESEDPKHREPRYPQIPPDTT